MADDDFGVDEEGAHLALLYLRSKLFEYDPPSQDELLIRDHYIAIIDLEIGLLCKIHGFDGTWISESAERNSDMFYELQFLETELNRNATATVDGIVNAFGELFPGVILRILLNKEDVLSKFANPEEGYGRYINLRDLYAQFEHTQAGKQAIEQGMRYVDYIRNFPGLDGVHSYQKDRKYKRYLKDIINHLSSFILRAKPLFNLNEILATEDAELKYYRELFESKLDLDKYDSAEEIKALGSQRLTKALQALFAKAGGSVEERAMRLYEMKKTPTENMIESVFSKRAKQVPLLEAQVRSISASLEEVIVETMLKMEGEVI